MPADPAAIHLLSISLLICIIYSGDYANALQGQRQILLRQSSMGHAEHRWSTFQKANFVGRKNYSEAATWLRL